MAGIGSFGDVGQAGLIHAISRATAQDKPAIAITAIDIAVLVNLEEDTRMAKCCRAIAFAATDGAGAVAADAAGVDKDGFRRSNVHGLCR